MYIKITDVNKTIKKAPILRDINLEFTGGKVYGLRGKNGSDSKSLLATQEILKQNKNNFELEYSCLKLIFKT